MFFSFHLPKPGEGASCLLLSGCCFLAQAYRAWIKILQDAEISDQQRFLSGIQKQARVSPGFNSRKRAKQPKLKQGIKIL